MIRLKNRRIISLILSICVVFASSAYVKADEGEYPDMTNTVLEKTSVSLYKVGNDNAEVSIKLLNAPDLYDCDFYYTSSNPKMNINCYVNPDKKTIEIYSSDSGKALLTFTLNNKVLRLSISISTVKITHKSLLIAKKKKAKLKIKNYPGRVKWIFTRKKIVSISPTGVVKAKKIGNTVAYAKIGDNYLGCAISVVSKKIKKVVNTAYKIAKGKYSRPKRMLKGYYDCSSLVWKSYKKAKIYLVDKNYAPVAADLAKYYVKVKKRKIKGGKSSKNISKMKLRPGDLYFCTGSKNGRYKGIYHVEMFTGYVCVDVNPYSGITILPKWATVPDGYYYDKSIMVRPVK